MISRPEHLSKACAKLISYNASLSEGKVTLEDLNNRYWVMDPAHMRDYLLKLLLSYRMLFEVKAGSMVEIVDDGVM